VQERAIKRFILPDAGNDTSLATLAPIEKDGISDAVMHARARLAVVPVRTVADCLRNVFEEGDILLAGLKRGFLRVHKRVVR
jgi:hypothetical protein